MIAVLLAASSVTPDRLDVAGSGRADPDARPGRRDDEGTDPIERLGVAYGLSPRRQISKPLAGPDSCDAWCRVGDVPQPSERRGLGGIYGRPREGLLSRKSC